MSSRPTGGSVSLLTDALLH